MGITPVPALLLVVIIHTMTDAVHAHALHAAFAPSGLPLDVTRRLNSPVEIQWSDGAQQRAPLLRRRASRSVPGAIKALDDDRGVASGPASDGKDEILKRLAATDTPKGPESRTQKPQGALPEWSAPWPWHSALLGYSEHVLELCCASHA
jgi:hypothetical protein